MFKATPDGKGLVELSLKQREQYVTYIKDRNLAQWPTLLPKPASPRDGMPRPDTPRPKSPRSQAQ